MGSLQSKLIKGGFSIYRNTLRKKEITSLFLKKVV
jgi:hypothetical protein